MRAVLEGLVIGLALLAAGAVWLPWSAGSVETGKGRGEIAFVGQSDVALLMANLASRPLLDPTRGAAARGQAVAGRAATGVGRNGDRFVLRGLASRDSIDIAVIEEVGAKKITRLQRGQAIGDWYLAEVKDGEARLMNGAGEARILKLASDRKN